MTYASLRWQIEETSLAAWPALSEVRLGDWRVRFAAGLSRRANSANPLRSDIRNISASIAACEDLYRGQGQPVLFRIPSFLKAGAEKRLEALGYQAEGESVTLHAARDALTAARDPEVAILRHPDPSWLTAVARLRQQTDREAAAYGRIVALIAVPAAFALLRVEGEPASMAYGAIHDGQLCLESVFTDARYRGRGFGRRVLGALAAWALDDGAKDACLQVEASNAPARALYRGFGMNREVYRYHYRREPLLP